MAFVSTTLADQYGELYFKVISGDMEDTLTVVNAHRRFEKLGNMFFPKGARTTPRPPRSAAATSASLRSSPPVKTGDTLGMPGQDRPHQGHDLRRADVQDGCLRQGQGHKTRSPTASSKLNMGKMPPSPMATTPRRKRLIIAGVGDMQLIRPHGKAQSKYKVEGLFSKPAKITP